MNALSEHVAPWYRPSGHEVAVFERCYAAQVPLLLKGPTGCGKSRLVEAMAARLGRPLVTVACNDETSAADLLGRWLLRGGDTVWQDGPVTRAVRAGAILYLDEVAEAREDVIVVLHPLTDHRRALHVDRLDEVIEATAGFMLVASYNPGYRRVARDLRPSTRQRFVAVQMDYPSADIEAEIVAREGGVDRKVAERLVQLAVRVRALDDLALPDTLSTRLLVRAATLIAAGLPARAAVVAGAVAPLSDDADVTRTLTDFAHLMF